MIQCLRRNFSHFLKIHEKHEILICDFPALCAKSSSSFRINELGGRSEKFRFLFSYFYRYNHYYQTNSFIIMIITILTKPLAQGASRCITPARVSAVLAVLAVFHNYHLLQELHPAILSRHVLECPLLVLPSKISDFQRNVLVCALEARELF